MRSSRRGRVAPAARAELTALLARDEDVLRWAVLLGGGALAVSRFALYAATGGQVVRWGWADLAKASLQEHQLTVVPTTEVQRWPDGTQVVHDAAARELTLLRPDRITDLIHARVRRSVAGSAYVNVLRSGGWAALRRVPGVDGLRRQVRLDPGSDPAAPGFVEAVDSVLAHLSVSAAAPDPIRGRRPSASRNH